MNISIIIRSRNEPTLSVLYKQMLRQKSSKDSLIVLNDPVPFEEKLRQSFQVALKNNHPYAVIIDADIIVCYNFIKKVKKILSMLPTEDMGFGLKVLDRFYGYPKYRGIHIYNVCMLDQATQYIPLTGQEMRPESFVKEQMALNGNKWNNDLSKKAYGIHDYFQHYEDIFCKISIRAHRSKNDIEYLMERFNKYHDTDLFVAAKALEYGLNLNQNSIKNDREIFHEVYNKIFPSYHKLIPSIPLYIKLAPELFVYYQIFFYKLKLFFKTHIYK